MIVHRLDISLHIEIDQLANRHVGIDANRLSDRNLERPVVAKAHIAFARGRVNVDSKSAYTGLSFKEGNVLMGFGVL